MIPALLASVAHSVSVTDPSGHTPVVNAIVGCTGEGGDPGGSGDGGGGDGGGGEGEIGHVHAYARWMHKQAREM